MEATSIRQDQLTQNARDLLAWGFRERIAASDLLPIPMTACEVKIENDVENIMRGGDGFRRHGGSESLCYFRHRDDPTWAVVFANDCDGDADRGAKLFDSSSLPT